MFGSNFNQVQSQKWSSKMGSMYVEMVILKKQFPDACLLTIYIDQLSHSSWFGLVATTRVIFTPERCYYNELCAYYVSYCKLYCRRFLAWRLNCASCVTRLGGVGVRDNHVMAFY